MFKRRISYLAFFAVALCVFIVVIVMTVMRGLVTDFKTKNHNFAGDCVVGTDSLVGFAYYEDLLAQINREDFIEAASPVIKSYGLVTRVGSDISRGVEIVGLDPVLHSKATGFGDTIHYRKDDVSKVFSPLYNPTLPGCVLGIDMALERTTKGDYNFPAMPSTSTFLISCFPLTSKGALAKAGAGEISSKTFHYSDVSNTGLARVDGYIIYLPFEDAQILSGMADTDKRVSSLHIKFKPYVKLDESVNKVRAIFGQFVERHKSLGKAHLLETVTVQSWIENRRSFVASMEKEQAMLMIMFSMVGLTTVFIILVVFYMIISHKSKDIGILKSLGVSTANVVKLFCNFALLLACMGSALGIFGGWLFLKNINEIENWLFEHYGFQMWDRSIYTIGDIPNVLDFKMVIVIIIAAIAACLTGAILPAWQGAKNKPIQSLQVNQL